MCATPQMPIFSTCHQHRVPLGAMQCGWLPTTRQRLQLRHHRWPLLRCQACACARDTCSGRKRLMRCTRMAALVPAARIIQCTTCKLSGRPGTLMRECATSHTFGMALMQGCDDLPPAPATTPESLCMPHTHSPTLTVMAQPLLCVLYSRRDSNPQSPP